MNAKECEQVHDSTDSSMTPRSLTTLVDWTWWSPTVIEAISSTGENCEEEWIISAFDTVQLRLLSKFQLVISSRHKVRFSKALTWYTLRVKMYNWVSSAYIISSKGCAEMISSRGAVKSENNSHLRMDPWGTPEDKYLGRERIPLRAMHWGQSLRYGRGIKSNEEPFRKSHRTIPKPIKKNSMVYCVESCG